ncbi:flagellar biosynthesis protein FlhB [Chenggangzhangella methanolivorans]|uniref:flagellar biosynthesis protein FlhB n=1 Tax=Chenggangzhangella methanolivorans TaxID=1437009 RepID=UPI00360E7D0C
MAESEGGEKTEEPTRKRLDDALKKGDVAKSQELSTWFGLAAATLVVSIFADGTTASLGQTLTRFLASPERIAVDGASLRAMFGGLGLAVAAALALPMLMLAFAGIAGNMVQHPPIVTAEPITPKFSKISPASGFKRIFSVEGLLNFFKGLLKILIVGIVIWMVAWPERTRLATLAESDLAGLLPLLKELSLEVMVASVIVFAAIAIADYLFARHRWRKKLMMSLQEIKDEHKQQEGDPHIKGRIRALRQQRSRKRMMAAVPGATVVIANPTHFAVALKYEAGMNAPMCVAKGVDAIALRIRRVAEEAGVTVIENPPLARSLHAALEIDREIPAEHYKAVAEVIGFVMRRRGGR